MGLALPRREALPAHRRLPLTEHPEATRAAEEQRRASIGYFFWPAALYEHYAEREPASSWYRIQTRQAVRFGGRWLLIALAALIWPLLASFFIASPLGVIIVYSLALVLDVALFVIWLRLALRYSRLAARGESFTV